MKWYHYGLIFTVIFLSLFLISSVLLSEKEIAFFEGKEEYRALSAASDAAAKAAFLSVDGELQKDGLSMAEEIFFQVLSLFLGGEPDEKACSRLAEQVVCFAVFSDKEIYLSGCFSPGREHTFEQLAYEEGTEVPDSFYEKVNHYIENYHNIFFPEKRGKTVKVSAGKLDRELSKACVFVLFAPKTENLLSSTQASLIYTASKLVLEQFAVTEDNFCHFPHCEETIKKNIIGYYTSEQAAAEHGASPCKKCFLLEP